MIMEKKSFYDHISANKRNSVFLILITLGILIFLGYFLGLILGNAYFGVTIAVIISLFMVMITFVAGDELILKASGAVQADRKHNAFLINTVEGLSIAAGIPKPKIYVIEDETINAFAIGKNPGKASVAATTGAIKKLSRTELEGVLGHEISHIKNYDVRFMMITVVMIGAIILLSDFLLRSFIFGAGGRDRKVHPALIVVALALAVLAPVAGYLIKLAVSRRREFLADANGALLTRHPNGLADALRKIKNDSAKPTKTANKAVSHLYFSNPFKNTAILSTHPPLDERIKRLENM